MKRRADDRRHGGFVLAVATVLALLVAAPTGDTSVVSAADLTGVDATTHRATGVAVRASAFQATEVAASPTSTSEPEPSDRPPVTANEFLPDDRNVTDCIGALERPGCGSESRGGWRQTVVFGVLLVGLLVIFGNIARGVRRNRSS